MYNPAFFANSQNWGNIPNKTVPWKGNYSQGGQKSEMKFNNFQFNFGGGIFGSGSDQVGQFNINGSCAPNGEVNFKKQYVGKHTVDYKGKFNGTAIDGNWSVSGLTGPFHIELETVEVWSGYYEQGGQKTNMSLNLNVDNNGVYGIGSDQVGQFVIRGQVAGGQVQFVKNYTGKHSVNYYGTITTQGPGRVIQGWWSLQSAYGKFELRSSAVPKQSVGMPGMPGMPGF